MIFSKLYFSFCSQLFHLYKQLNMYRRSPILRAALSPSQKTNERTPNILSDKIQQELSRIRIITGKTSEVPFKTVSPRSLRSQVVESEQSLMNEMQSIQTIVTEVISLFQEYRESVDKQIEGMRKELDSRVEYLIADRVQSLKEEIALLKISNVAINDQDRMDRDRISSDLFRLRSEMSNMREDQSRLEDKLRRINKENTEVHQKSNMVLNSFRDVLINKPH